MPCAGGHFLSLSIFFSALASSGRPSANGVPSVAVVVIHIALVVFTSDFECCSVGKWWVSDKECQVGRSTVHVMECRVSVNNYVGLRCLIVLI